MAEVVGWMPEYRLVAKKGEGTFSEVLKAQCIKNGKYVAIKCMKNHFDSLEQVNNLREIQALRRLSPHPNIIKLLEVLYDQPTGRLALVFELMDMNIYELIRGRRHYVPELLSKMKRQSAHMDFNFPPKEGSGIEKLIPHVSAECVDLIAKLLAYNPDDRLSARQALRHPYFKELRDADKRMARSSVDGAPSHASIMPRAERSLVHRSNAGNAIGAAALPTIGISSGSGKHRAEDKENAHAYGSKGSHGTHGSHGGASDIGGLSVGGSTGSKVGGHSYGHSYAGGYHSKHKHGGGGHSYGGAHKGLPLLAVGADDGAGTSGLPPIGVGGGVGSSLGAGKPGGGTFGAARKHVGGTGHSYNYSKVLMGMRPLQQKAGNSQSKVSVMRGRATMRGQQLNAGGSTSALRKPRAKAYVSPYSQAAIGERDKERERRH
eukprot:PRCOL_00005796-RA